MYFDAVLDVAMQPAVSGTRNEILNWLEANREYADVLDVCVGETLELLSATEYMKRFSEIPEGGEQLDGEPDPEHHCPGCRCSRGDRAGA